MRCIYCGHSVNSHHFEVADDDSQPEFDVGEVLSVACFAANCYCERYDDESTLGEEVIHDL